MKFGVGIFYENMLTNFIFGQNRTKTPVTSPEEPNVFHVAGTDIRSAAVHRTRGCLYDNACNVHCIVDSDTYADNVKTTLCSFTWKQWLRERASILR